MTTDRIAALEALLAETEAAHGAYETTELNGVYDQEWPRWYAAYAVEHGIGEILVGHAVSSDDLAAVPDDELVRAPAGGSAAIGAVDDVPWRAALPRSCEHRDRDSRAADRGADRIQPRVLRAWPHLRLPGHPARAT